MVGRPNLNREREPRGSPECGLGKGLALLGRWNPGRKESGRGGKRGSKEARKGKTLRVGGRLFKQGEGIPRFYSEGARERSCRERGDLAEKNTFEGKTKAFGGGLARVWEEG